MERDTDESKKIEELRVDDVTAEVISSNKIFSREKTIVSLSEIDSIKNETISGSILPEAMDKSIQKIAEINNEKEITEMEEINVLQRNAVEAPIAIIRQPSLTQISPENIVDGRLSESMARNDLIDEPSQISVINEKTINRDKPIKKYPTALSWLAEFKKDKK